ncbi:MAG: amino acid adenylation domain-containing protein, partial [Gemmatimonadetes bacterium]|nr:amino acid adenylation domain-containing protein [Gemmatimonadota bacterium]
MTPLQQGMLAETLRAPSSGINVEQVVCRLADAVDRERLQGAWWRVVARHDALRTRFRWADVAEPVQEVLAEFRPELAWHDWADVDPAEQQGRLERHLARDRAHGFALAEAPPVRLALFRLSAAEHVLVWSFHHILLDARSVSHVLRDVFTLYDAGGEVGEPELPPRPPFREHVAWLRGRDAAADRAYWTELLRGVGAPARVHPSRGAPRDPDAEPPSGEREIRLSDAATAALRTFEREQGVWLNTLVQGAWALLLARYTGSREAVFGVVRGGRAGGADGADAMVGLLINTVPVRVPIPPAARVIDWLEDIGERAAALAAHEHAGLSDIVQWSALAPGALYDTLLDFQPQPFDAPFRDLGKAWLGRGFRIFRRTGVPLSLAVTGEAPLRVRMEYDADLWDAAAADRMLAHFARLLEEIAADPARPLHDLDPLDGEERHRALQGARGAAAGEYRADGCVHRLFQAQAERAPDAPAVLDAGGPLPYAELDRRANRLAHLLRRRGVGPEVRVGVCMERGPELLVCILGVLKAGGAYVPVDPGSPAERIALLLRDSAASLLLADDGAAGAVAADGARVLRLDALRDELAAQPEHAPEDRSHPQAAAYVLYTSGSTGTPKGVVVPHGAAAAHLRAAAGAYALGPEDRVLAFAAITFDPSIEQILAPLAVGAAVAFRGPEVWSPAEFADAVERLGLTVVNPPTAYWHALAADEAALARVRARVRLALVGGEALRPASVAAWHRAPGAARLLNLYGPTEGVVTATLHTAEAADGAAPRVPVGTALGGRFALVLDERMRPVPEGVPGEVYLGGPVLARGYHGRPAATAASFVPDPYGGVPGARLYRTGDRACRLPAGGLDVLGRLDDQVKIRGFRIEPGEAEAALRRHPRVRDCAVVARESEDGEKRLVAYVVGAAEPDALREHLRRTLPFYLVPAAFVALDRLPLSPNGKVDRRALPAPGPAGEPHALPRTPVEQVLAQIWAEVLRVERVGVDDAFGELGGHSLRAMQVVSRVRAALGVELPVRAMFETATVARLAERVEALRRAGLPPLPPVRPAGRARPLPLSFAQERLWFLDRLQPGLRSYNLATAQQLRGPLDAAAL